MQLGEDLSMVHPHFAYKILPFHLFTIRISPTPLSVMLLVDMILLLCPFGVDVDLAILM
jgi:hypothetical protein